MSLQPIEIIEEILGAYAEDGSAMRCDEIHAYLTALRTCSLSQPLL
ncbi:hypothetical protein [Neisseria elongata]|nr:hypothetical protein [Neisseria elongata]